MDRDTTAELSDDLFDYSINVLMLDPKRVVMEASQKTLIGAAELGGRTHPLSISELRAFRGLLPLRHPRHSAPGRTRIVLLV